MDYSKNIKEMDASISILADMLESIEKILRAAAALEEDIVKLDNSLPTDDQYDALKEGPEKKQLRDLYDKIEEAYIIIDQIFGDDPAMDGPEYLDDILRNFPGKKGKTNAS